MNVLVIVEHDNKNLSHATLTTLQAALQLAEEVSALVVGFGCHQVAEEVANYKGVQKVLVADHAVYEHLLPENIAKLIAELAPDFTHLLAPADTFGKNLMPRVAGILGFGQISDITKIIDNNTFERPIYAGNANCKIESLDPIKLITVRGTAFESAAKGESKANIEIVAKVIENKQSQFIDRQLTKSDRPELTTAKIIISGGRGLQNADNFKLLEQLAEQLGAAIGASRAAVDAGFVPNDYQVGQTGKVVAPELYIAVGISGAIQHIAGMKESKVIVAINKDPDAPIFSIADYGLVGDLFKILPELQQELSKLGYS
jgi:electron transfer flavoprotein alpha subunit